MVPASGSKGFVALSDVYLAKRCVVSKRNTGAVSSEVRGIDTCRRQSFLLLDNSASVTDMLKVSDVKIEGTRSRRVGLRRGEIASSGSRFVVDGRSEVESLGRGW